MADLIAPQVRQFGAVNWRGFWTLYLREVRRFLKVSMQTIIAPVVTTLLYLAVFILALGGQQRQAVAGVAFTEFLAPGLIMMAMVQNAFANTSSSLIIGKMQGNIVDVLMPPLSPLELTLGFALGGVTRGLAVGLAVAASMAIFIPFHVVDPALLLFHAVAASLLLSVLGLVAGIWADKIDHLAAVTNFVVMPLSFLSGTFYSIDRLPGHWRELALFNPFFYMIDGFRYSFIGHADGSLVVGVLVLAVIDLALVAWCYRFFATGYKLKA